MADMYFSRARLDTTGIAPAEARRWSGDGYKRHQWVWRLFEAQPEAERDFLYRVEPGQPGQTVYLVSARPPMAEAPWRVEAKPYAPTLSPGERLAFCVRVNPVIKHKVREERDGKPHTKHRREDVVMAARREAEAQGGDVPPRSGLIQEAGSRWLAARAEDCGFALNPAAVVADGYQHQRLWQRNRRGQEQQIGLSTVELSGVLEVTDPERFVERALFRGIGPSKGFGCGLMMVRRAG